jgi:hypothetical protein
MNIPALDLAVPYGLPAVRAVVMQASDGTIALRIESPGLVTTLLLTAEAACDLAFALNREAGACEAGPHVLGTDVEVRDDVRGDRVVGQYLAGCRECIAHVEREREVA